VLLIEEKIAGAQDVWHERIQRRLPSTLTEASIIDAQHCKAGPAEELDIVQVRGEVPRRPRTKQDNRGLLLGHFRRQALRGRHEPKTAQELALSVGESYLISLQAEIRWYLIAIAIREEDESIEETMEHRSNNA
jgi:hypothetical protein